MDEHGELQVICGYNDNSKPMLMFFCVSPLARYYKSEIITSMYDYETLWLYLHKEIQS